MLYEKNESLPFDEGYGIQLSTNSIKILNEINFNKIESENIFNPKSVDFFDIRNNKISILAPMGLALFGYAEGDAIDWRFPVGDSSIDIIKVAQEEYILKTQYYDKQHSGTSQ